MPLETASTIAELNENNPVGNSDTPASLDNHIQLIKAVLKADALVNADIGVAVQAYDSTILKSANIGSTVQGYDADTAKTDVAQSWTAKQTFGSTLKIDEVLERITITTSAPATNFDCLTQAIQYFTSNTSANWTQNFRGDGSNTLNSQLAVGESITVTVLATQSTTGYLPTTIQVDGTTTGVTTKYLGGTAWTADASCINAFTFTIIKTADATFTVLASKSKYA